MDTQQQDKLAALETALHRESVRHLSTNVEPRQAEFVQNRVARRRRKVLERKAAKARAKARARAC